MINDIYFSEFPELESKRLIFRKFNLSDAKDIHSIRTDKTVMTFMDTNSPESVEDAENFISNNLKTYGSKDGIFWAIIEKSTNEFIGDFAYWNIIRKDSRAQIGYTLKPAYWGKGFMKETMIELVNFGFNKLHIHSFEADVNPENENSKHLLLKVGFKKEAYFRENYYFNGKYLDSEIYSLLESDFNYY